MIKSIVKEMRRLQKRLLKKGDTDNAAAVEALVESMLCLANDKFVMENLRIRQELMSVVERRLIRHSNKVYRLLNGSVSELS